MSAPDDQGYPLSPHQRRVWLQQEAVGSGHAFRAECTVEIEGRLDPGLLTTALQDVVDRHEILRTSFRRFQGVHLPLQMIEEGRRIRLRDEAAAGDEADLSASLAGEAPSRHVLRLSLPALCADTPSFLYLVQDLARSYEARLCGRCPDEVETAQYADISTVLNDLLGSEATRRGQRHWRHLDLGMVTRQTLPYTRPAGGPGTPFVPREVAARWPGQGAALDTLAARLGLSLEAVLLACWQLLLGRLTQRPEVTVGVLADGRSYDELRGALGLLARHLPVQARLEPQDAFRDFAQAVASDLARSQKWRDFFSWRSADGDEEAQERRYFPFAFELQAATEPVACDGVRFVVTRRAACLERFEVQLVCSLYGEDLEVSLQYDAARLAAEDAGCLASHFAALCRDLVRGGGEVAIGDLDILGEEERRRLLADGSRTAAFGNDLCLHELFERQARETPESVALETGDERLAYRELNARADRLAAVLRTLGVGRETLVALCVERSLHMVVGMLGILKAGGAYVPLDPGYPAERLGLMLGDSGARFLLVTGEPQLPAGPDVRTVRLDAELPAVPPQARQTGEEPGPDSLAYVIYTSGSTGRPKGVMVSHRAICNRLLWMHEAFPLGPDDRVLQKTVSSFDASIWEIFLPLMTGARTVLALPGAHQDAAYMVRTLVEREITVLQLVPSFLSVFLGEPGLEGCVSLRRLFSGGEALPGPLAVQCRRRLAAELCNLYGPTEAAIDATYHPCGARDGAAAVVPIGRPIANVQVYLLDDWGQPVPTGLPGELHIGGVGLARGYLGRPDLTAERFVPDPFAAEPGRRLYRTGDRAVRNAEGVLSYLGRTDSQVKLRGYRIELGEVEAALCNLPQVRSAVATVWEPTPGDLRLVGYVVPAEGARPDPAVLRRLLQERLPSHMVPSVLLDIPALPLSPNGKVDRAALPKPEDAAVEKRSTEVPRTPVEEVLLVIWSEVLGLDRLGIHDDFFENGGHSLLAIQVVGRVRDAFHVKISVRDLFEAKTIARLGQRVEELLKAHALSGMPPLERAHREGPLPLSFAQRRLWFLSCLDPESPVYNIAVGFRMKGALDLGALRQAVAAVVRRHEALRTSFHWHAEEGEPIQVIEEARTLSVPLVDLTATPAGERLEAVRRLAVSEGRRPFDLAHDPLLRILLVRLDDRDHAAVATMHHIVSDGWSAGLLVDEITAFYEAFHSGAEALLSPLPIQYADYAVWQRSWLRGTVLEEELAYWRGQLAGAPGVLELPTDRPRPREQNFDGAVRPLALPAELSAALRRFAQAHSASLFMVLLAAYATVLARYSGQDDLVVGSPIANRTRAETEGLIGFFVNTLVLRSRLDGRPTFLELVERVRTTTLEAYSHQEVPFEKLVEELRPARDLGHTPLFQVAFTFQNVRRRNLGLAGLELTPFDFEPQSAKFDLTLLLADAESRLEGALEYNSTLFHSSTIQRFAQHFERILAAAVVAPSQQVADLPLLSAPERLQLLTEWAGGAAVYPVTHTLHDLFAAQVRRAPDAVAVVHGGEHLTYGKLAVQAAQVTRALRAAGVRPGMLVALLCERSLEMVIAVLGVLGAGAAYLPIDPESPAERLRFVLQDSRSALAVTHGDLAGRLPADMPRVLLREALASDGSADTPGETAGAAVGPDHPAYVIYTSGSTGLPKGVIVSHANVVRLLSATSDWFQFGASDVWTLFHSYAFDFSVWELWGALAFGGRLVVVPHWMTRSPGDFHELLRRERVTVLNQTPSAFLQLARTDEEPAAAGSDLALRVVIFGGEMLDPASLAPWIARRGDERPSLINMYGITETTVHVTYRRLRAADVALGSVIGEPIPDLRLYVLDREMQPVPIGVAGEIHVGGAGVAGGYLARPALTAERFLPDPFPGAAPGARLYKTGDVGRHRPDGEIEYLGRTDHQVKIRGLRIELGEIEAALLRHPAVRQAVVVVREVQPGDRRLVAYVVGNGGPAVAADLKASLREALPDYMIPAQIVTLDAMPLNVNGKVDRAALPVPEMVRSGMQRELVASRDPVEEAVADVWCEVLGLDRVGVFDNFFELGGHSLLAMQVVYRLRDTFYTEVSVRQLFAAPTVADLAATLVSSQARPGQVERIAAALKQVKEMSPEEVNRMLQEKRQETAGHGALEPV